MAWVSTAVTVGGALLGGSSGGGGGSSQSSESAPWAEQQPYLSQMFQDAQSTYNNGASYYQGQLTPGINQNMQAGMTNPNIQQDQQFLQGFRDGNAALGQTSNPTFDQNAMNAVMDNPYVQQQVDSVARDVNNNARDQMTQNNMNAGFMGSTGSSSQGVQNALVQNNATNTIADASTALRSNAFNQGINTGSQYGLQGASNRLTSLGMQTDNNLAGLGVTFDQAQQNFNNTANMGQMEYGVNQDAIQAEMQKWQYEDDAWANLDRYRSLISGNYGGTSSSTSNAAEASDFDKMLGGATSAFGLGKDMNWF